MNVIVDDFLTCTRCRRIAIIDKGTEVHCLGCGLVLGGPTVELDFTLHTELRDAIQYQDVAQVVRLVLAGHADGLVHIDTPAVAR
jgi:hypothetical protein